MKKITEIASVTLPEIIKRMHTFCDSVTKQWGIENQIIGLDSLDIKLGGVLRRLEVSRKRVSDYINGEISSLEELERDRLLFKKPRVQGGPVTANNSWRNNVTANVLV